LLHFTWCVQLLLGEDSQATLDLVGGGLLSGEALLRQGCLLITFWFGLLSSSRVFD
jgi:hypothetical protein